MFKKHVTCQKKTSGYENNRKMEGESEERKDCSTEADDSGNERHILDFGDETLLHIVKYLVGDDFEHGELVNLAATCAKFRMLLQDRSLSTVVKIKWSLKCSRAALVGYLRQRSRTELVTKFRVTDLYWVPSGVLRDVVTQMPNLKELLAAGARLSWAHLKEILTVISGIESLSWSWDNSLEESVRRKGSVSPLRFIELQELKPKFLTLKRLLLHVPIAMNQAPTDLIVCSFTSFVYLISLCQNLEQLFILSWPKTSQERKSSSNFFQEVFELDDIDLPFLKVLVVDVKEPPRIHVPRLILKLLRNFERNRIQPRVLWVDDPLINRPVLSVRRGITSEDRIWPVLDMTSIERFSLPLMDAAVPVAFPKPFPSCKALQITHGMPRIVNLNGTFEGASNLESLCCKAFNFKMGWRNLSLHHPYLKEINLCKNEGVTYPDYCAALAEMSLLRKISIPLESLIEIKDNRILTEFKDCSPEDSSTGNELSTESFGFKKKRIGASTKPNTVGVSGLQLLTNRCSNVEEIEIGYSSKSCHAGRLLVDSLFYMTKWKCLRKLSLEGVPVKHGKFLIEIAKSATHLESIRLSNLGPTGRCSYMADLTVAIKHCHNLKDLRLEQTYIGSLSQLLLSLQNCHKLQRLLLWSSTNDVPLDCEAVKCLFAASKNLVVFYAVIESTLKSACKKLKKFLNEEYKAVRPSLSIFIETSLEDDRVPKYPSIHFRQLVMNTSQVCQYNDFPHFYDLQEP